MTEKHNLGNIPSDAQLCWASRRGMLELDLLLVPYVESHVNQLSDEERLQLWSLLQEDDPWLYEQLLGKKSAEADRHQAILKSILVYARST